MRQPGAQVQAEFFLPAERGCYRKHQQTPRAIVEGLQMIKKHTRKNQQNPNGAIVEREGTIHISNLMKAENAPQPAAEAQG